MRKKKRGQEPGKYHKTLKEQIRENKRWQRYMWCCGRWWS